MECCTQIEERFETLRGILAKRRGEQGNLISVLQQAQSVFGYLPVGVQKAVAAGLGVPLSEVYSVATFYAGFRSAPPGKHTLNVCMGTACYLKGAQKIIDNFKEGNLEPGESREKDIDFSLETTRCMGCCALAPVTTIDDDATWRNEGGLFTSHSGEPVKTQEQLQALREKLKGSHRAVEIHIGMGTCGMSAGAALVAKAMQKEITQAGATHIRIVPVGCIGLCDVEPIVEVIGADGVKTLYTSVSPRLGAEIVKKVIAGKEDREGGSERSGFLEKQTRISLKNLGKVDPTRIDSAIEHGGYGSLAKAICQMARDEVLEEVKRSGLRGCGGGGFPTGVKWGYAAVQTAPDKCIVANADEGNPGAFMDRTIIEGDPHILIEGLCIAGYAIGANRGLIYVRDEYPVAVRRLENAVAQAGERGLLGKNILGTEFSFDITICRGAGAYVCGEETALLNSIEGKRGEPRLRPPFPAVKGLWGMPTVINNVETLSYVPAIIEKGAAWFSGKGRGEACGTKVFSVCGSVNTTGVIEVPMGITLREILYDLCGGPKPGRVFQAVQLGGPSGTFIPVSLFDVPLDYESMAKAGGLVGAGGLIVMDDQDCIVDTARYFLEFSAEESCGKCIPCRIGLAALLDMLENMSGQEDAERIAQLSRDIIQTAHCGLGQTAPLPLLSALKNFPEAFEAYKKGTCSCGGHKTEPVKMQGRDEA